MPCYRPSWKYQLQPGTPAYEAAKSKIDASLTATRHVIDFYLALTRLPLPMPNPADAAIMNAWSQSVAETSRLPPQDLGDATIARYGLAIYLIAQHMSCDGVGFEDLWDQQSLLSTSEPRDLGYGWLMRWCVGVMTRRFAVAGWSIQLTHRDNGA